MVFNLLYLVLGYPGIIAAVLRSLDIPFLDENMLRQVTMSCTSDSLINFVNYLYGI